MAVILNGNTAIDFSSCSFCLESDGIKEIAKYYNKCKNNNSSNYDFCFAIFWGTDIELKTSLGTSSFCGIGCPIAVIISFIELQLYWSDHGSMSC